TPDCEVFGDATMFTVDCGTAIEDIFDVASFKLYPNPNDGQFSINMDVKEMNDVTLQIVDVTGRLVMNRTIPSVYGNFTETFDLKNNLTSGFYVFNVKVGDYQSQIKFIVQ
ncbi:MAG: T9SS type A sorting domain-containing protein, partial [Chitinophagales bacterium]